MEGLPLAQKKARTCHKRGQSDESDWQGDCWTPKDQNKPERWEALRQDLKWPLLKSSLSMYSPLWVPRNLQPLGSLKASSLNGSHSSLRNHQFKISNTCIKRGDRLSSKKKEKKKRGKGETNIGLLKQSLLLLLLWFLGRSWERAHGELKKGWGNLSKMAKGR